MSGNDSSWNFFLGWQALLQYIQQELDLQTISIASDGDNSEFLRLAIEFQSTLRECATSRRIFITSTGNIEIGSDDLRPEDSLVLFPRSPVPLALCKNDNHFTMICRDYTEGIMHGEAFDSDATPPPRMTNFNIR